MSDRERHGPVNDDRAAEEALKAAFQKLGDVNRGECSTDDLDRIWRALDGTLGSEERRELIDRLASDPALAEAWRVADELHAASAVGANAGAAPRRPITGWRRGWLAAAAVLLAAVSAVFVFQRIRPADATFRGVEGYSVESLIGADVTLPRNEFQLRWTPGPPDTRYQVSVTTEALQVLTIAADLPAAEYVVPGEILASVPSGNRVLWQVDARLPGGERKSSATFTTRVR
jgi:hypothetical protein